MVVGEHDKGRTTIVFLPSMTQATFQPGHNSMHAVLPEPYWTDAGTLQHLVKSAQHKRPLHSTLWRVGVLRTADCEHSIAQE